MDRLRDRDRDKARYGGIERGRYTAGSKVACYFISIFIFLAKTLFVLNAPE